METPQRQTEALAELRQSQHYRAILDYFVDCLVDSFLKFLSTEPQNLLAAQAQGRTVLDFLEALDAAQQSQEDLAREAVRRIQENRDYEFRFRRAQSGVAEREFDEDDEGGYFPRAAQPL